MDGTVERSESAKDGEDGVWLNEDESTVRWTDAEGEGAAGAAERRDKVGEGALAVLSTVSRKERIEFCSSLRRDVSTSES